MWRTILFVKILTEVKQRRKMKVGEIVQVTWVRSALRGNSNRCRLWQIHKYPRPKARLPTVLPSASECVFLLGFGTSLLGKLTFALSALTTCFVLSWNLNSICCNSTDAIKILWNFNFLLTSVAKREKERSTVDWVVATYKYV